MVQALSHDAQALQLQVGDQRWGLLPDRQAWRAWREQAHPPPALAGLWLGFTPDGGLERQLRRWLPGVPPSRLWWPVAGSRSGWRQS